MFTIDNKFRTAKVRLTYIILTFATFAFLAYFAFEPNTVAVKYFIGSLIMILILTHAVMLFLRLNYFFIQDNGEFIIIRFYTAHPFFRKYKALKFPVRALKSYEIKHSFFKFKKDIIIEAETKTQKFVFPALSLSLMSPLEISEVKAILDKHLQ